MLYDDEKDPYVNHLVAEHRRLHMLLRNARSAIMQSGAPDRDVTTADVVGVLTKVRGELAQHFSEEESGGCLEEAVSRCPRLATEATRLQGEHAGLLVQIDKLIAQALDSRHTLENRIAFEREFDEVCLLLHAHEAAENELLRQGLGRAVNGDSCEPLSLPLDA
jgi:hypothetical protein